MADERSFVIDTSEFPERTPTKSVSPLPSEARPGRRRFNLERELEQRSFVT
jgi:hypothetical protein